MLDSSFAYEEIAADVCWLLGISKKQDRARERGHFSWPKYNVPVFFARRRLSILAISQCKKNPLTASCNQWL